MSTKLLQTYILPLLPQNHGPRNLKTIRIGTKALTWWPRRFLDEGDGENDAKQLLRLLEDIVASGDTCLYSSPCLSRARTPGSGYSSCHSRLALYGRCHSMSSAINVRFGYCSFLLETDELTQKNKLHRRHVNDSASAWADMWRLQTSLGTIPYYMFVERDTGAADYFAVPLSSAFEIYSTASSMVSGLSRTARGPSMSTSPGKICVRGIETISQQKVFVLQFVQSRNPQWCHRTFFAEYDSSAVWFDQLKPAFGEARFFFESEYEEIRARAAQESSGQIFQGYV